jgi:hypothetical protein
MSNGKGDKPRKGANLEKFRDNYDEIDWSKGKEPEQEKKCSGECGKCKCRKDSDDE